MAERYRSRLEIEGGRIQGFHLVKPTKACVIATLQATQDMLEEYRAQGDMPVTIRQIFYRLVSQPELGIPKSKTGSNYVGNLLIEWRHSGYVSWRDIRDDTDIQPKLPQTWDDPEEFLRDYLPDPEWFQPRLLDTQPWYQWPAPENESTLYVTRTGSIWCDRAILPVHGSTVSGAGGR